MTATQPGGIRHPKGIGNIGIALLSVQTGLRTDKRRALQNITADGNARTLRDGTGQEQTLIVPTLSLTLTGQRHGDDDVDAGEEAVGCQFVGCQPTDGTRSGFAPAILDGIDEHGAVGMGMVADESGGTFRSETPPEETGHGVIFRREGVAGARQVHVADGTDDTVVGSEAGAADETTVGKQGVVKACKQRYSHSFIG